MTSYKQVLANKSNGLKGGVKTDIGKKISSKNARKHGALAKQVLKQEREKFEQLLENLTEDYKPKTTVQHFLVERLALRIIQSSRINFAAKEFWKGSKEPTITGKSEFDFLDCESVLKEGYHPAIDVENIKAFSDIIHRYETAIENQVIKLDKALVV